YTREDDAPPVGGLVDPEDSGDVGVMRAQTRMRVASDRDLGQLAHLQPDLRAVRGDIHTLSHAESFSCDQRRHDPEGKLHRPGGVGDQGAWQSRWAIRIARGVDQAATRLSGAVQHALIGVRARGAKTVYQRVNEPRIPLLERNVSEATLLQPCGTTV